MGTHPIFESDFDCLTDSMTSLYQYANDDVINLPFVRLSMVDSPIDGRESADQNRRRINQSNEGGKELISSTGSWAPEVEEKTGSEEILEERLRQIQLSTLNAKKRLKQNFQNVKRQMRENEENRNTSPRRTRSKRSSDRLQKSSDRSELVGTNRSDHSGRDALVDVIN